MAPILIFNFKGKITSNLSEQVDIAYIFLCSRIIRIYVVASNIRVRRKDNVLILNLKGYSLTVS